jgi:hypothetical protein
MTSVFLLTSERVVPDQTASTDAHSGWRKAMILKKKALQRHASDLAAGEDGRRPKLDQVVEAMNFNLWLNPLFLIIIICYFLIIPTKVRTFPL